MTPIEWNDSEPAGFPDFLPPKPEAKKLTSTEAFTRIEGVLAAAGIKGYFCSHHYGVDIELTFPDGARFERLDCSLYLRADGYTRR